MLVIGITGGIGSGKTAVSGMFAASGAVVISADALAREIMEKTPALKKTLKRTFGEEIFTTVDELDRVLLSEKIFTGRKLREKLDAAVHPYVLRALQKAIRQHRSTRSLSLLFVEAALIFESGADRMLDYVIVVDAKEETRIRRVMEHRGLSRNQVLLRMKAQLPQSEKVKKADFVLNNDDDLPSLERKVAFLNKVFHTILEKGKATRRDSGEF